MATTDDKKVDRELEAFFEREILPLSASLKPGQRHPFPLGPDPAVASYYVARKSRSMQKADFEQGGPASVDAFESALVGLWKRNGADSLVKLAPAIAKFARALHSVGTQGEQVSEFIYVMY